MENIKLSAAMDNLYKMLDFIGEGIAKATTDKKILYQIRLVCEEVLVNVISYAYTNDKGDVTISYELSETTNELTLIIADSGIPFNPLEKETPDIDIPLDERQIGGLGIFMVRNIMDRVDYKRENGENVLTLKKTF